MKIDCYAHIVPPKFKKFLFNNSNKGFALKGYAAYIEHTPTLFDLDHRFRIMDKYPDVVQLLTLSAVSVDDIAPAREAAGLAQRVNDEMSELVWKYPDRFTAAVASLSMSDMDVALKELDRCIKQLKLRGVQLRIPVNGKPVDSPEFLPLYDQICTYNLPIWWHPQSRRDIPNYEGESESQYGIFHLWGLPFETTVSMTRLVFGGILEKYPKLKIITHHCGAMISFFSGRIINHCNSAEMRHRTDYSQGLTKHPIDYFRMFYNDTAIFGNTAALMCAFDFFGADHLLFGTDMPYDPTLGDDGVRRIIEAIEKMTISDADKKRIFEDNARRLMRLPI
jgi:predicted TIM-barrel fold metal-dependent hydrolase